jgi:hypothetical protein
MMCDLIVPTYVLLMVFAAGVVIGAIFFEAIPR